MSTNLPTTVYRVSTKTGPRYYRRGRAASIAHRLMPLDRATAELAIAAGASVYVKAAGQHWLRAEEA